MRIVSDQAIVNALKKDKGVSTPDLLKGVKPAAKPRVKKSATGSVFGSKVTSGVKPALNTLKGAMEVFDSTNPYTNSTPDKLTNPDNIKRQKAKSYLYARANGQEGDFGRYLDEFETLWRMNTGKIDEVIARYKDRRGNVSAGDKAPSVIARASVLSAEERYEKEKILKKFGTETPQLSDVIAALGQDISPTNAIKNLATSAARGMYDLPEDWEPDAENDSLLRAGLMAGNLVEYLTPGLNAAKVAGDASMLTAKSAEEKSLAPVGKYVKENLRALNPFESGVDPVERAFRALSLGLTALAVKPHLSGLKAKGLTNKSRAVLGIAYEMVSPAPTPNILLPRAQALSAALRTPAGKDTIKVAKEIEKRYVNDDGYAEIRQAYSDKFRAANEESGANIPEADIDAAVTLLTASDMELRNQAKGAKPDISGDLDVRGVNRTKVQEPAPEPASKAPVVDVNGRKKIDATEWASNPQWFTESGGLTLSNITHGKLSKLELDAALKIADQEGVPDRSLALWHIQKSTNATPAQKKAAKNLQAKWERIEKPTEVESSAGKPAKFKPKEAKGYDNGENLDLVGIAKKNEFKQESVGSEFAPGDKVFYDARGFGGSTVRVTGVLATNKGGKLIVKVDPGQESTFAKKTVLFDGKWDKKGSARQLRAAEGERRAKQREQEFQARLKDDTERRKIAEKDYDESSTKLVGATGPSGWNQVGKGTMLFDHDTGATYRVNEVVNDVDGNLFRAEAVKVSGPEDANKTLDAMPGERWSWLGSDGEVAVKLPRSRIAEASAKAPKPDQILDSGKMVKDAPVAKPAKDTAPGKKEPWEMTREDNRARYRHDWSKSNEKISSAAKLYFSKLPAGDLFSWGFSKKAMQEMGVDTAPLDKMLKDLPHLAEKTQPHDSLESWVSKTKSLTAARAKELGGITQDIYSQYKRAQAESDGVTRRIMQANDEHKFAVETAIKEGKPVPKEVLADYPDLAKKYGTAKPAKDALVPAVAKTEVPKPANPVAKPETGQLGLELNQAVPALKDEMGIEPGPKQTKSQIEKAKQKAAALAIQKLDKEPPINLKTASDAEIKARLVERGYNDIKEWRANQEALTDAEKYESFYVSNSRRAGKLVADYVRDNYGNRELTEAEVELFHYLSAMGSPSNSPVNDSSIGLRLLIRVFEHDQLSPYVKDAEKWTKQVGGGKAGVKVTDVRPNEAGVETVRPGKDSPAYDDDAVLNLIKLRDEKFGGDLAATLKWMQDKHPWEEVNGVARDILKKKIGEKEVKGVKVPIYGMAKHEYTDGQTMVNGVFALNPAKLGSYWLNRLGHLDTVTKDMWWARTMMRHLGQSLFKGGVPIKEPWKAETAEGLRYRRLADEAWREISARLEAEGYKETDLAHIQEQMWDYEQKLWIKHGMIPSSGNITQGVEAGIRAIAEGKGYKKYEAGRPANSKELRTSKIWDTFETLRDEIYGPQASGKGRGAGRDKAPGLRGYTRTKGQPGQTRVDGRPLAYTNPSGVKVAPKVIATYTPNKSVVKAISTLGGRPVRFHEIGPSGHKDYIDLVQSVLDSGDFGKQVSVPKRKDLIGARVFISDDGLSGFALIGENITGLISRHPGGMMSHQMLQLATDLGGRKLDAFDTYLVKIYAQMGFQATHRIPFSTDPSIMPKGWNASGAMSVYNNGKPDLVFMKWNPGAVKAYQPGDGKMAKDYLDAAAKRDASILSTRADWESAGKEAKTGILYQAFAPKQTNKGTYVWDAKQKRGLITLFENADISTILHETAHHQLRYMPKDMYRVIAQGAGVDPNTDMDKLKRADYVRVQEFYARGVEDSLYRGGINPNPKVQAAFNHAAKRIKQIYGEAGVPLPEGGRGRGRGLNQAEPQTKTPAFKKWFGDSKVVDEKGEPLVVYHGTGDIKFDIFNPHKIGVLPGTSKEKAIFFTDSVYAAEEYANIASPRGVRGGTGKHGSIMPVYLRLKNPFVIDAEFEEYNSFVMRDWIQQAKQEGHDGLIIYDMGEHYDMKKDEYGSPLLDFSTQFVVFEPTQIKSAIANKGTFDPNDPSILNQGPGKGGEKPDYSAVSEVFAQMLGGTVKPLREAPMDSMPVKTGAKAQDAGKDFGTSNAAMQESANMDAPMGKGKSAKDLIEQAKKDITDDIQARELAEGVRDGSIPYNAETAARANVAIGILEGRANTALKKLSGSPSDANLKQQYEDAREAVQTFASGIQVGKSGWSDVGRVLQARVDEMGNVTRMQAEAERMKGSKLTPKEAKAIEDIGNKYAESEAKVKELTAQLEKTRAEMAVRAASARPRSSGAIRAIREDAKTARELLLSRTLNQLSKDASTEDLVWAIAKEHILDGDKNLQSIAKKIADEFEMSPDEVIQYIGAPATPRTKSEVAIAIAKLRNEARKLTGNLRKAKPADLVNDKVAIEKRLAEIKKKIQEYQTKLKAGDYSVPTKAERARTLELENAEGAMWMERRKFEAMRRQLKDPEAPVSKLVTEATNIMRMAQLGMDMGQLLRQGRYVLQHPRAYGAGLKILLKAAKSEDGYAKIMSDIESKVAADGKLMHPIRLKHGLALTDQFIQHEEAFTTKFFSRIPVLKQYTGTMERAQVAFMNTVRAEMFDAFYNSNAKLSADELKTRARMINSLTGRSNAKNVPKWASVLMTSPRWYLSRWELLKDSPKDILGAVKGNKGAQANLKDSVASVVSLIVPLAIAHGILNARDEKDGVTLDPASPDFLKIRYGERVYDISAGIAPRVRFAIRAIWSIIAGDNEYFGKEIFKEGMSTISPGVRTPLEIHAGESLTGIPWDEDKTEADKWMQLAPLIAQTAKQSFEKEGAAMMAANVLLEFTGAAGSNTYPRKTGEYLARPNQKAKQMPRAKKGAAPKTTTKPMTRQERVEAFMRAGK
jgi:hypothetical protein